MSIKEIQMTEQTTAHTTHGEVTYELVECSSCGNDVPKENAQRFVIGEYSKKFGRKIQFDMDNVITGWACEYCHDHPTSFPRSAFTDSKIVVSVIASAFIIGLFIGILL